MILKQNTFNLVVETVSSSEISSASLSNPFRESETSRNLTRELRAAREFVFKVIDNLSWIIDFYWSITMCGTLAEVPWSLGCYSRGAGFRAGGFSLPSPSPSLDFCARPLVPGSARLKNPRWRSISERNGFSAMKPPVTACKQARLSRDVISFQN